MVAWQADLVVPFVNSLFEIYLVVGCLEAFVKYFALKSKRSRCCHSSLGSNLASLYSRHLHHYQADYKQLKMI